MRRVVMVLLLLGYASVQSAELDQDLADFKREVLEVNKRLLLLEEALVSPVATQVGVYVSLESAPPFEPESIVLALNGDVIARHVYTEKEVRALRNGAIQRLTVANVEEGSHKLSAVVTGVGAQGSLLRREVKGNFEKRPGRHVVQLYIEEGPSPASPRFRFRDWR